MRVPKRKFLIAGGVLGILLTSISTYWLGRREQIDEMLEVGKDEGGSYNFYHNGRIKYKLNVSTEEAVD